MVSQNCPGPSWYVIENVFCTYSKNCYIEVINHMWGATFSVDMNYKQFGAYFSWVFWYRSNNISNNKTRHSGTILWHQVQLTSF